MKKITRIALLLLVASMLLSLFACGGGVENETKETVEEASTEQSASLESESATERDATDGSEAVSATETATEKATEKTSEKATETTESQVTTETEEIATTAPATEAPETETAEKAPETTVKLSYGYDFKDASWSGEFTTGGSATRALANDPTGSGEAVLALTHGAGQTASWIRNKNNYEADKQGTVTVSVDLYIPSDALGASGDYVQMQINGEYNHHTNLVSDAKENPGAFDTKNFPRDKWFKVQFIFDMDKLRYDLVVVEDGEIRAVIFSARSASNLAETGILTLRVFLSGESQTVYVDHLGIVTESEYGEVVEKPQVAKGVSFLRIDGVNASGEKLSLFGDFTGGASVADLTDVVWERSNTFSGTYQAVSGANGASYTPKDGGYYLRVSAKYGKMALQTYPVYIREQVTENFAKAYLSVENNTLSASVVYNNEQSPFDAQVKVVIYEGNTALKTYTENFRAKQGSDLLVFTFEDVSLSGGKRAEMTVLSGGKALSESVTVDSTLPKMIVQKKSDGTAILANKKQIAYFKQNRYMQFRPNGESDHWKGTEHNPIDMGFAYQEDKVKGLSNISVDAIIAPGVFKVVFVGEKVGLKATQRNELIGFWDTELQSFTFIYNASMTADTETWHENSGASWASQSRVEIFDYCSERMSILDRVYNKNQNGDLYDYVIYENGSELIRIPKLPVPYTLGGGTYFYGFRMSPGESMYLPDAKEGGWEATLLQATGDTYIEICWSWYDIHNVENNSVPRIGYADQFTVSESWLFTPTTAEHDKALIGGATEVPWQDQPNYQLPLFSTSNTFEKQFGGTDWQYAWWKSSSNCSMDATVGHDGAGSVKVERTRAGEDSWYTEGVWGYPYSFDQVQGKIYRVSGYIKTENVVGEAYIANIQYQHATPNDNTVTRSQSVSGTSDWTYVSFTFVAQERKTASGAPQRCIDHFFLTLDGTGTVWFDDVKIEEVK